MAINRARHKRKGIPAPVADAPSPAQVDVFLATYEETFSEYVARKKAGISRVGLATLKDDPAFVAAMAEAFNGDDVTERLRAKALEMAIKHGSKDIVINELKARLPEIYGTKSTITVNVDVKELTIEELEDIVAKHGKKGGG